MDMFLPDSLTLVALLGCFAVALVAGVVKGMVGFAMPMIMVSGLGSIVGPEWALAGLILPTLCTNGWQAMRAGPRGVWQAVVRFRVFLAVAFVMLILSAQLVSVLPARAMQVMIGLPIVAFALSQLLAYPLKLGSPPPRRVEVGVAMLAGGIGGFSGVWGPPTVAYLTALETPKRDQLQLQGVIYGLGAVALLGAHIGSGVLSTTTAPFSAALVPVALVGMWIGFRVHDRIDQVMFRRATLVVLLIAGGNLLRQGLGL
ncbi:sulfite exporter TauE/SafE family protein [Pseudooceanicola spongiae]|uniref:Probable membrane transporter protein n=1 Tax=Pseudooceanicola spongiae TaxID=2613965 RepID=A0A7L9WMJ7_9RHOB|nr:sulfite exporter TauE/SafE family protein [Pseudooceanicola spongiae]QOL81601.1 TSUP family transporter [Pseudooceanicola spongiae]